MIKQNKRVLAVDDEPNMRRLIEITLRQAGYRPVIASNGKEALNILKTDGADIVISDLHMPEMDGISLLKNMRESGIQIPVIIVTAHGEIQSAVEAMKLGAADYILRPFDLETIEIAIDKALSVARLQQENDFLKSTIEGDSQLIGQSLSMQQIKQMINTVAKEKVTVLISGETGTGKEIVAKAIHENSDRKQGLFVAINCAAIPADILESELFGHEKGAFTGAIKDRIGKFELANEGTIFLDEITEMPLPLQAKLLRALQENRIEKVGSNKPIELDIRIIAATNRNPLEAVKQGSLREDLYYRLNVIQLEVPALRQRLEDVPLLTQYFLQKRACSIEAPALLALQSYAWPGNVRELENVLERASILCQNKVIQLTDLPMDIQQPQSKSQNIHTDEVSNLLSIPQAVEKIEIQKISEALKITAGNKSKAAKLLEISERSLWNKLSQYQLK